MEALKELLTTMLSCLASTSSLNALVTSASKVNEGQVDWSKFWHDYQGSKLRFEIWTRSEEDMKEDLLWEESQDELEREYQGSEVNFDEEYRYE